MFSTPASAAGTVPVEQRYLFEARQMQALSLAVHIPLVCFGIAFPVLVLFAEWRHLRTGDLLYRTLARRWSKIMLALFAVGVVTGTILSFELGLLWPVWMKTSATSSGSASPWRGSRSSPRPSSSGSTPTAGTGSSRGCTSRAGSRSRSRSSRLFFVIAVNAWMNHPTGFTLSGGRAVNAHPWSALFANPFFWSEYVHMYFAAYIVAGFLMAGAYAWGTCAGGEAGTSGPRSASRCQRPPSPHRWQVVVGDWAARDVAQAQPVKLAAMEGLAVTTRGAAEHLLGWYNGHSVVYGIEIPRLLSLLAFHHPNAVVKGLNIVPLADQPPVNVVRFAFQTMVGIGTLLALLGLVYLFFRWRRGELLTARWFCWAVVAAGPLSVVALIAGWITTEVGRQPWIVYEVMRVDAAVTGAHVIPLRLHRARRRLPRAGGGGVLAAETVQPGALARR